MADHSVLDEQIRRIRQIEGLAERSAPAIAKVLEGEILSNARRQVGPDGEAWPKTESGDRALQNVAQSLTVRAIGTVVVARLVGRHARHDLGRGKGGVRRRVLPSARMPAPIAKAIDTVVTREFEATMGGRR